jgi:hypothetical protein
MPDASTLRKDNKLSPQADILKWEQSVSFAQNNY